MEENTKRENLPEDIASMARAYLQALANGLCPVCNQPVEQEQQAGRCVYAKPCGHRLYQGKARRMEGAAMAHFSMEEENRIYEVARKHLMKTDSNVTEGDSASLVWRNEGGLIVVVWATKDIPTPEWDVTGTQYYTQYNYHVALKVVYRNGNRRLCVVGSHEGGRNVWDGPFKCGICEYDVRAEK